MALPQPSFSLVMTDDIPSAVRRGDERFRESLRSHLARMRTIGEFMERGEYSMVGVLAVSMRTLLKDNPARERDGRSLLARLGAPECPLLSTLLTPNLVGGVLPENAAFDTLCLFDARVRLRTGLPRRLLPVSEWLSYPVYGSAGILITRRHIIFGVADKDEAHVDPEPDPHVARLIDSWVEYVVTPEGATARRLSDYPLRALQYFALELLNSPALLALADPRDPRE